MDKGDKMSIWKNKIDKGAPGYIDVRKKAQLYKTILMFGIAAAIFVLGLALNQWQKSNVFTIVAALAVLPASKMLISYIVLAPYHSLTKDTFERLIATTQEQDIVFTDVVCTSSEKVMNLSILVIVENQVLGLIGRKKENRVYIEKYLRENFKLKQYSAKIHIFEEEEQFVRAMKALSRNMENNKAKKEWEAYLKTLMV